MENWIGAGVSASGTAVNEKSGTAKRYTYKKNIDEYIKNPEIKFAVCEELDKETLIKESILMGYRYCKGPDNGIFFRRFKKNVEDCIPKTIEKWKEKDKMLFLNGFLMDAFSELDEKN
jgi:oxygen-independent coproporphyrinogen-3 oxidase